MDPETGKPNGSAEALPHYPERVNHYAWSPDRWRIAFVQEVEHWEDGPRTTAGIVVYAADAGSATTFGVSDPPEKVLTVWWNADGREVLYRSIRWEGGVWGQGAPRETVRALDPSTGEVRDLFPWSLSRRPYHLSDDGSRALFFDTRAGPDSSRAGWVVAEGDGSDGGVVVPLWDTDGWAGNVQLSPRGDRLLFDREKDYIATIAGQAGPDPGTLWVAATDGTGLRRVGTAQMIRSAVWDPSSRFVAYSAAIDNANSVLRIVDVATGEQRDVPLPGGTAQNVTVADWSRDGRFIGIITEASRIEFWVIEGLLDTVR